MERRKRFQWARRIIGNVLYNADIDRPGRPGCGENRTKISACIVVLLTCIIGGAAFCFVVAIAIVAIAKLAALSGVLITTLAAIVAIALLLRRASRV